MKARTPIKPLALAAAASLSAAQVLAQPALEEVVVTARKKAESLMDTPLSVVAVSGASMDESGITNLNQLSASVPGLTLGDTAQTTSIYIRGIGSGINKGFEQSAGMYVDGIYQTRSRQFSMSMVDVAQLEILRGPQSILFGKNTIAGAIKLESANPQPGDPLNGYLAADVEPELGLYRATAVISGGMTDNLAGRLALRYQEAEGAIDNHIREEDGKAIEDVIARGTLVWEASERFIATGKLSYIDSRGDGSNTVNAIVDPSLLATLGQPGNSLGVTDVMGAIAAFQVPAYQASRGGRSHDSWLGNEQFFPGGTDEDELQSLQASLRLEVDLDRYTLTSLTGYTDFDEERQQDVDFHGGNVVGEFASEELQMFSQELRLASNFDGPLNFTAGLYYEAQDGFIGRNQTVADGTLGGLLGGLPANSLNPALPAGLLLGDLGIDSVWNGTVLTSLNPAFVPLIGSELDYAARLPNNDLETGTIAGFVEVTWDITDDLTLELGGRYSRDTREVAKSVALGVGIPGAVVPYINTDGSLTNAGTADPLNAALLRAVFGPVLNTYPHDVDLDRSETHFDPSARLVWNYSDAGMAYLSYSTGYKSGGFNSTADTFNPDGTPGDGTEFEDETATAWELGLKTDFWEQRGRLGVALFHTSIDDLQVTSFRGTNFLVGNAASMTSRGMEFDTQLALTDALEVGASIAYLDSEFDDYADAPCTIYQIAATAAGDNCRQDLAGRPGPFAPEWSGNFYAAFEASIGNGLVLRLRGDASYKDDYHTDSDLDPHSLQEAFWKLNARVGLSNADNTWEVALYGRNLTNEATMSYTVDAPLSAGIYANGREEPRIVGLQASYKF